MVDLQYFQIKLRLVAENSLYNRVTSGVRIDLPYDSCNTEVSQVDAEGKIYFKTFLKLTPSSTMSIFTKE